MFSMSTPLDSKDSFFMSRWTTIRYAWFPTLLHFSEGSDFCSSQQLPGSVFFPALNHLSVSGDSNLLWSKRPERSHLPVVIGRFQPILFVSVFWGSLGYLLGFAIIFIDWWQGKTYFIYTSSSYNDFSRGGVFLKRAIMWQPTIYILKSCQYLRLHFVFLIRN